VTGGYTEIQPRLVTHTNDDNDDGLWV